MNAYFDIIQSLMWMFCMITLFTIPVMYIFSSYKGLANAPYYPLDMWSLGNMGKLPNAIIIILLNYQVAHPHSATMSQ